MTLKETLQNAARKALGIKSTTNFGWLWTDWSSFGRTGIGGPNYDLLRTDWGAATAQTLSVAAYRAVDARMRAVGSMPWRIMATNSDKPIDESTNTERKHPLGKALYNARRELKYPLFSMWEMSMCITGKAFIEPIVNRNEFTVGLDWLNPLGVQIVPIRGVIDHYMYSGEDGTARYEYDELVYERFPTLLSDYEGLSPLYVALDRINIELNTDRFLRSFFANDSRFGQIITPKDGMENFGDHEIQQIQQQLKASQGSRNAWRSFISPIPIDSVIQDSPDLSQHVETIDRVETTIYTALGVPRPVAGDVDSQRYQASPESLNWFYQNTVLPRCRDIEQIINTEILPRFDKERVGRFEFDTSEWERLSETRKVQLEFMERGYQNGVVTFNELRGFYNNYVTGIELQPIANGDLFKVPGDGILSTEDELGKVTAEQPVVEAGGGDFTEAPDNVEDAPDDSAPQPEQPAPTDRAAQDSALDELRTWRRYVKKHDNIRGLDFETFHLEDWQRSRIKFALRDVFTGGHFATAWADAFDAVEQSITGKIKDGIVDNKYVEFVKAYADSLVYTGIDDVDKIGEYLVAHNIRIAAQKAIQATRIDFEDSVEDLLLEAVAGNIDRRRFGNRLRNLVQVAIGKAFIDGLEDGGITEPQLTDEDSDWIGDFFDEQRKYVIELTNAIYKDDRVTEDEAKGKPAMWFNKSVVPAYHEGLASASKNGAFEWVLGKTEEHCRSCLKLDGQVRRISFWQDNIMPQSGALACKGYRCDCRLQPSDRALSRGRLPAWRAIMHDHAH